MCYFLAKISKQKCPGPAEVVKLCLKKQFYELYLRILKISLHFPPRQSIKQFPKNHPLVAIFLTNESFCPLEVRSPSGFSCGALIFSVSNLNQILSATTRFFPPAVGTLSHQEFSFRVSLGLLYYFAILETIIDLQKHRYNSLF